MKHLVARAIWKICGISPGMGNRVMDTIGYSRYMWVMNNK